MTDAAPVMRSQSYGALVWQQFRRDGLATAGLVIVLVLFVVAVFAPFLANDRPLLVKPDAARAEPFVTYRGQEPVVRTGWFSPAVEGLQKSDLMVFVAFAWALAEFLLCLSTTTTDSPRRRGLRLRRHVRGAVLWGVTGLALVLCAWISLGGPRVVDERTDWVAVVKGASPGDVVVLAPVPHRPAREYDDERLSPPGGRFRLGTDDSGRDVASQLIHGARVSLAVGFVAVGIAIVIGIIVGAFGGYFGGQVDFWAMRLIEVMMCFPTLFLIITISVIVKERSIWTVMAIMGVTGWPGAARLVRGEFLKQRAMEYVTAAQAVGDSPMSVMFRHILPNAVAPVLVTATFGIAGAIITESVLSFLSLGVPPEAASWGRTLSAGLRHVGYAWWLATFPGLAIFVTVTAYNLAGEGLRDAIDPRMRI
jgi:peptide/nickel transport system permease protein